jgi:putative hydrolase of the HAD superfamily
MPPVIKAVLFDLDGTLIDHDAAAAVALTQALQAQTEPGQVDQAHARRRWKQLEEDAMQRYLSGHLTFSGQRRLRITSLAAELGLGNWDGPRADTWFAGYLRHYESAWRTYPDVRPAIFRAGCARLHLAPAQVAYIGDRLDTDAIAATNAGLPGIWLNRNNDQSPTRPPAISTLQSLPALLTEFGG